MPNKTYDNFFLANEIEDQYNSHLDLVQFCTVDNSLTGTAGIHNALLEGDVVVLARIQKGKRYVVLDRISPIPELKGEWL